MLTSASRSRRLALTAGLIAVLAALLGTSLTAAPASAAGYERYLDLPLTNRFADKHGGGVNKALPTDLAQLTRLVTAALSLIHI